MIVRELELDLDAFEGPFDLLLTLILKEELDLADVDVAGIVVRFVERLAEREELDLDACGEFLVLVAALLELKARGLFEDEAAELSELEPEEAAEEVARRLAEDRRLRSWRCSSSAAPTRSPSARPRRSPRSGSVGLGRRALPQTKGPSRGTSAPPSHRQPARPARAHAGGAARRGERTAARGGARRG